MGFDVQGINLTEDGIFETMIGLWTGKEQAKRMAISV
jgi:hypothetical protein